MSERDLDTNYTSEYGEESKQCRHCVSFRSQDGHNICLSSSDKSFAETLAENGEIEPTGHCDFFQAVD